MILMLGAGADDVLVDTVVVVYDEVVEVVTVDGVVCVPEPEMLFIFLTHSTVNP